MRRHWLAFFIVIMASFIVLGWQGVVIYHQAPPIPKAFVTPDNREIISGETITRGQNVWQSIGGMEVGSVWGHGSYVAPDWSSDYLHRELTFILDIWARQEGAPNYDALSFERQAALKGRLKGIIRRNTYDSFSGKAVISPETAKAIEANAAYYSDIFSHGRSAYAIPEGALTDKNKLNDLASFFFWSAWAASTDRPGKSYTYTLNWPHEPLIDNLPTAGLIVWSGISILLLLAGVGLMVWYYGSIKGYSEHKIPSSDLFEGAKLTPSQKSVLFYFIVAGGLMLVQILTGIITAHYGVEGNSFFGISLAKWAPYVVTRTWHVQTGLFWIATSWLAAGLFIGPFIGGREPKYQAFGVWFLLTALFIVVAGSMIGEYAGIYQKFTGNNWFWFGHQGYEYIDLGRAWQILLFAGLIIWFVLVLRAILPAFRNGGEHKSLLGVLTLSLVAIGGFYGAGLMWGQKTPLPIVEYWRWWVVHLWVEGFFEVFATAVVAFLFARMSLIQAKNAGKAVLFSSTIYLTGGIIGTLHHLYFSGTPVSVMAFGSVFSALEIVPLVLVGFEAWENIHRSRMQGWVSRYRWPAIFFVSVAFWNLVGAGLFGFLINPPIALYYMQGLNTTPLHGHAALFGVYGMLGLGLMLFCLRAANPSFKWSDGLMKTSFWSLNLGLFFMCVFSLLPVGLLQTWASVERGYWYARSAEFLHMPIVHTFKLIRIFGDGLFSLGAVLIVCFIILKSIELLKQKR